VANPDPNFSGGNTGRLLRAREAAQGRIDVLEASVVSAEEVLLTATADVATARAAAAAVGGPAADPVEIAQDYDARIAAVRDEISALRDQIPRGGRIQFDGLSELRARLAELRRDPGGDTLAAWERECGRIREALAQGDIVDVSGVDCQPSALTVMAQSADRYAAAALRFEQADCNPAQLGAQADVPPDATSQDRTAALRAIVERARTCINLTNEGQEGPTDALSALTELESTWLGERTDIRRSIADLQSGAVYAQGAMGGAVFVDLLILIISILAKTVGQSSHLHSDPTRPPIEAVRTRILRVASSFSEDGTPGPALRTFLSRLEARFVDLDQEGDGYPNERMREMLFRKTVMTERASPQVDRLVDAILNLIPPVYLRRVKFDPIRSGARGEASGDRIGISETIVTMITEMAYDGEPVPTEPIEEASPRQSIADLDRIRRERRARKAKQPPAEVRDPTPRPDTDAKPSPPGLGDLAKSFPTD
jgi:hypothetical protein